MSETADDIIARIEREARALTPVRYEPDLVEELGWQDIDMTRPHLLEPVWFEAALVWFFGASGGSQVDVDGPRGDAALSPIGARVSVRLGGPAA
jgi:hypothetical protein